MHTISSVLMKDDIERQAAINSGQCSVIKHRKGVDTSCGMQAVSAADVHAPPQFVVAAQPMPLPYPTAEVELISERQQYQQTSEPDPDPLLGQQSEMDASEDKTVSPSCCPSCTDSVWLTCAVCAGISAVKP